MSSCSKEGKVARQIILLFSSTHLLPRCKTSVECLLSKISSFQRLPVAQDVKLLQRGQGGKGSQLSIARLNISGGITLSQFCIVHFVWQDGLTISLAHALLSSLGVSCEARVRSRFDSILGPLLVLLLDVHSTYLSVSCET